MQKLRWAVKAGDQIGDSEDDQKCGDHYIDKSLECHDGDAHRPTPGSNPYFQGDRKGPEDKSKTPAPDSSGQRGHERDRDEQTPQHKGKQERQEEEGHTPESYAEENVDRFADMMEEAYQAKTGKPLAWSDKQLHDLTEMVMRQTARQFPQDADQLGFHDSTEPPGFKGKKGRALWRPRSGERRTEFDREGGGKEYVPPSHEGESGPGLYQGIFEKAKQGRKGGGKQPEASLARRLTWGKIMQDRTADNQPSPASCPDGDVAEGRPCGEGEDPEQGKCNPNMAAPPSQPRSPESDSPKTFRNPAQEGVGLQPSADPGRQQRMAQHVSKLTQDDGSNPANTANNMGRMMGSPKPRQLDDGSTLVGSPAKTPQEAKQQNDDYKSTLTDSGWVNQSDMGGSSTWKKGNTTVQLKLAKSAGGQSGNQMKIVGPKPQQPKKKGLFR